MLDKIKQFLTYNSKERSGTLIMMCIILILIMANLYLPYLKNSQSVDYSLFEKEIVKFEKARDSIKSEHKPKTPQLAESSNMSNNSKAKKPVEEIPKLKVDINLADSSEFTKLKGIGAVFASRIVKYRRLLGGYTRVEQLEEVYGMDEIRYRGILPYLTMTTDSLTKIDLNTATFKEILKHPYISYEMVKEMVNYRDQNGGFSSINELKNIPLIDSVLFLLLIPYLKV